jgi:formylglycine-generating enzyme required for sulfatase activity
MITKQKMALTLAVLLTTTITMAQDRHIASPLETKVKKLPPPASIRVPAKEIEAMKKVEAREWTIPGIDLKTVRIPAGKFTMGSPKDEPARRDDEAQREVTISKPFYMGVYEVSQRQYYRLLKADFPFEEWTHWRGSLANGMALNFRSRLVYIGDQGYELLLDNPMECITFSDALIFCKAINEREERAGRLPKGYEYRLPTEAEWEYACRAGSRSMFGPKVDEKRIVEDAKLEKDNETANRELRSIAFKGPGPDGTDMIGHNRKPNAWGLYDMHGNVAEWVLDSYAPYKKGNARDPLFADESLNKVTRGGSYRAGYEFMRSAARYPIPFDTDFYDFLGMRLVLAPKIEIPQPKRPAPKPKEQDGKKKK